MLTTQENNAAFRLIKRGITCFLFRHPGLNLVICRSVFLCTWLRGQTWVRFQIKQMARVAVLQFLLGPTLRSCAGLSRALIWAEPVWRLKTGGGESEARSLTERRLIRGGWGRWGVLGCWNRWESAGVRRRYLHTESSAEFHNLTLILNLFQETVIAICIRCKITHLCCVNESGENKPWCYHGASGVTFLICRCYFQVSSNFKTPVYVQELNDVSFCVVYCLQCSYVCFSIKKINQWNFDW